MKALINNKPFEFDGPISVLEAARKMGYYIPTLCAYDALRSHPGACGLCLVQIKMPGHEEPIITTSCKTKLEDGMEVITGTKEVRLAQRRQLELLFADHEMNCVECSRHGRCELLSMADKFGVDSGRFNSLYRVKRLVDFSDNAIHLDANKCIRCERCVEVCGQIQGLHCLTMKGSGLDRSVSLMTTEKWADSARCVRCGQCTAVCPTGSLRENDQTSIVMDFLADPALTTVFQFAPAVRATLGEEFGLPAGANVEKRLVAALKHLGADFVLDTNFSADVVIMEEGTELLGRLKDPNATLPMFTSCCPAWINFVEQHKPELIPHISTTRSPQAVMGALVKRWLPQKAGVDAASVRMISIMPCTAKKNEAARPELASEGTPDTDVVLTVREFGRLLRGQGIDLATFEEAEFDTPFMSQGTGAAVIFGKSAGVAEAAARTINYILTGQNVDQLEFKDSDHPHVFKELIVEVGDGSKLRIGVVHGLANADHIADEVLAGKSPYDFIEVMTCPGGCVNGGGTPREPGKYHPNSAKRTDVLDQIDKANPTRQSHNNPMVKELYDEYLGEPNSHLAHEILHTHYSNRQAKRKVPNVIKIWESVTLS